jgi:hypothetical protein
MPSSLRARGTKAPTPAAMNTARACSCVPWRGADVKAPMGLRLQSVPPACPGATWGWKGAICCCSRCCQFVPGAHGHAGDVVDGFVAVQLHALAARVGQGVDDVGAQALQAQLEHLEQAHRARADDDGIGFLNHGQGSRRCDATALLGQGAVKGRCASATGVPQRVVSGGKRSAQCIT